jgi:hypothetical protein
VTEKNRSNFDSLFAALLNLYCVCRQIVPPAARSV